MSPSSCFHCALALPPNTDFTVTIDGIDRPVCCPGCKAVAELIRDSGMAGYYAMREAPRPGLGRPVEDSTDWTVFDRNDMRSAFTTAAEGGTEATIYVGKMYCTACSWLIESSLATLAGVTDAEVNPITHRLRIRWRGDVIGLGTLLQRLADLGYEPQPLAPQSQQRPELAEQRTALKRLLVASVGMMQVMMFAIGLYAGDYQGMSAEMQHFLRLVSFVVTTPVVFYAARPFFTAAWRGIVRRAPGMDLPVAIAIGGAYLASVYATATRGPAVWFDSVTMFIFFLTLGRFLEMRVRHRSVDRSVAVSAVIPNTVTRLAGDTAELVPASRLAPGDTLVIKPGESIPADGVILSGRTSVDEALLSGESQPRSRSPGESVVAGSINLDGLIEVRVDRVGGDTTLGTISRLSERARYARPAFVQLADRLARFFVIAVLAVAAIVAGCWFLAAPARAFEVTLSVLVVTCPCALALATPAAFAAAGARLTELRVLVTNGNAIETLARSRTILFDKTGTVTMGKPVVTALDVLDARFDEAHCRRLAAALEAVSTHPLAEAFVMQNNPIHASDLRVQVGAGVAGSIDSKEWRLGRFEFVAPDERPTDHGADTCVYLGADARVIARFHLADELRTDAAESIAHLRELGLNPMLLSGDNEKPVAQTAESLGIEDFRANCSPEAKLQAIQALQEAGKAVIMVGDGINDAPVLAGADASVAPSHGALLAQTSADIITLGDSLAPVVTAVRMARQTMRIVRQNLTWAVVYNATALPLAALGYVPPWAAALGMSASSLIVVINALRLSHYE